ncbi:PREDICTED: esterase FE4-like [Papilio polytes]|uniref:esterase FE4-like n=1 Tax=Papilio polytes TaxID=76194 RepID=UPI000675D1F0|nr:PREDICTED: esterase FE4-like [Papilio polytes]
MKWVALMSLIVANVVKVPTPVVRTSGGLVRGRLSDNGLFYTYLGIPYGYVGEENRFKAPLPPLKWKGVFEAIEENVRCPQKMLGSVVVGEEDCLRLNVYTPATQPSQPLPVMLYIHGGCFFEGAGTAFLYGGDYFVEHDVVFVGINYRLNVEGFLCLGIEEAPGNAGLKDQVAALRWVRDNIKAFGGDPGSVTLFGESAGAVSSSYLISSPAARGLFHKVILQSGSSLAPWGMQQDPIKTASNIAKEFGYTTVDPRELYDILSRRTPEELILAVRNPQHKNYITAETLLAPCIEKPIPGVEPVVAEHPVDVIASGNYTKVPMIIGYNDNEGIYFVAKDYGTTVEEVNPSDLLSPDLEFPGDESRNTTAEMLQKHYFSSKRDDLIMGVVELYSDLHFKFPSVVESELYLRTSPGPIYFYQFQYSGYINLPKQVSRFGARRGASHADELFYMFKPASFPLPQRYLETHMIQRMVTLWTNFAKYSDPTPQRSRLLPVRWRPGREGQAGQAGSPSALVIDRALSTAPMWDERAVRLWNQTYAKYRRRSFGHYGLVRDARALSCR